MAIGEIKTTNKYIGLSSDTKPTSVPVGSEFFETDTGDTYITYNGTNWIEKID